MRRQKCRVATAGNQEIFRYSFNEGFLFYHKGSTEGSAQNWLRTICVSPTLTAPSVFTSILEVECYPRSHRRCCGLHRVARVDHSIAGYVTDQETNLSANGGKCTRTRAGNVVCRHGAGLLIGYTGEATSCYCR